LGSVGGGGRGGLCVDGGAFLLFASSSEVCWEALVVLGCGWVVVVELAAVVGGLVVACLLGFVSFSCFVVCSFGWFG